MGNPRLDYPFFLPHLTHDVADFLRAYKILVFAINLRGTDEAKNCRDHSTLFEIGTNRSERSTKPTNLEGEPFGTLRLAERSSRAGVRRAC